jgi:hypothetical protein
MDQGPAVRFIMTCIDVPSCKVFFEPEGAETTLAAGDVFTVEMTGGEPPAIPEISVVPEGIIIAAWTGADTRVTNRRGEDLHV